jgi:MOSC domain-containing protein YiiM
MAQLLSVSVGLPRDIAWKGRTVHTAIWKNPVRSRAHAGRLNLDGDGQGDLAGHGGEQRAVFVYQIESYRNWQEQLKRTDFVHGQFGENFTIEGLPDDAACIGDRYQIGGALFEVTQPRVHLLSRRHSNERADNAGIADIQRATGVLLPNLKGG